MRYTNEWDQYYRKLYALKNLQLSWKRIETARNYPYKNYYRNLFLAYELKLDENLQIISDKLKKQGFEPSDILRFYIPKNSGLHRPITFLHLDDLIIYQAIANIFLERFRKKLKKVQYVNVFSNKLNLKKKDSIFLFQKWEFGYRRYRRIIKKYFMEGNIWVAQFDLAAYYDTINHATLLKQFSIQNAYNTYSDFVKKCFTAWCSYKNNNLNHGIPQGPISSNLIGEIYLNPIDDAMLKKGYKYVRYVDDIRIFAKTKLEAVDATIFLEQECKERGLIPQSSKYKLFQAHSFEEAIGKFPSLTSKEKIIISNTSEEMELLFKSAFNEKDFDLPKVRYILKVADKNKYILQRVIDSLHHYPHLVDEFCAYLKKYVDSKAVSSLIYKKVINNPTPYSYVQGRYWELLSLFNMSDNLKKRMLNDACELIKRNHSKFCLKYGLYCFLCSSCNRLILKWIIKESSILIQAFIIQWLPEICFNNGDSNNLLQTFLKRKNYEPALTLQMEMIERSIEINQEIVEQSQTEIPKLLLNIKPNIDYINKLLTNRYGIKYKKWKKILKNEYDHANLKLFLSEKNFHLDKNAWVNYIALFLEILCREFIKLASTKIPTYSFPKNKTKDNKGNTVINDIGVIYDALQNKNIPSDIKVVFKYFQDIQKRRNHTHISHSYDKKTLARSKNVTRTERNKLINLLKLGLTAYINEIDKII